MAVLAVALLAFLAVFPVAAASDSGRGASVTTQDSTAGAGYVLLNGQKGSVSAVFDSYTQPAASCPNSTSLGGTGDNIQIGPGLYAGRLDFARFLFLGVGTEAFCPQFSPTPIYFAYFIRLATVPSDPFGDVGPITQIVGFTVNPGDAIGAALISSPNRVTLVLEDHTSGETFVRSIDQPGYEPNGAACLLLPWGTPVRFADFTQRCRVTVDGATHGIGDFPPANVLLRWILVSFIDGTTVQAVAARLTVDGSTFTTSWVTSKPFQPPIFVPRDSNLSGYVLLTPRHGSVTAVSDSYVQPRAQCVNTEATENATGHYPGDQAALVGPGLYSGNSNRTRFEQIQVGTEAMCPLFFDGAPSYLAVVLLSSRSVSEPGGDYFLHIVPGFPIHPGDVIHSSLRWSSGGITLRLVDPTDHERADLTLLAPGFVPNGAACLLRPIYNLANFTRFTQSCEATVGGVTGGIGDFAGPNSVLRFDVTNATGGVQARASPLSDDGSTFSTTWVTSEPLE
ncbi:MAG: hypothetical protein L3K10_03180 [Thermoplasmata archaeon]|nr:hypothetical protein [Thermoplasmata archaeon]